MDAEQDAGASRVPPPLPQRRPTRTASPLPTPPSPPPPPFKTAVAVPQSLAGKPEQTQPPPLPSRARAVSAARQPEAILSTSSSAASLLKQSSSHVSIVTPSESGMDKGVVSRPQTPVNMAGATAAARSRASSTPQQPILLPAKDVADSAERTDPAERAHPSSSPPWKQYFQSEAALGLSHLRWAEIAVVVLLVAQLLGFKAFALAAAVGLGHFFYVWVIPRPENKPFAPYPPPSAASENVVWINETLRTLFPLISTDILAPFVDLLEDALMEQVPPVVTSVRVSSVSLGSEPVLLTSMHTITDEEWFASLTEKKGHQSTKSAKSVQDVVGNGAAEPVTPDRKGSLAAPSSSTRHSRSASNASRKSLSSVDATPGQAPSPSLYTQAAAEQALRKRHNLLRRIRNRRYERDSNGNTIVQDVNITDDGDNDDDEEGTSADEFVNYEVSFSYRRTADMRSRGTGLHMLAHFGWGVRGVGGSEIPVYIDVVELRGTVRVRILLSPSPPFAREASFSFVTMPDFDISARPLRTHGLGSFNAMDIPLLKSYVQKSIAQVAGAFVAPRHYHMNVERLLLGQDASLRTRAVGVLHIIIHGCSGLPRTDAVGSCDPYVAISYKKFNKPLFSTRTIVDTQDPLFEEAAFLVVDSEAIEAGEKLVLRVCDSDRFSADDVMGIVDQDVGDIVERSANSTTTDMFRQTSPLVSEQPGMRTQGELDWSVRFYPLWKMPDDELEKRIVALKDRRGEGHIAPPWWLEWLDKFMEKPTWEAEREERRKETLEYFNGHRKRDEIEAESKPPADMSSGILQFHIHQCTDLELESLAGTYSGSSLSRRKSAASGKPALNDVIDRAPSENPDPPSSYCEVHLNDKYVYRTRTKQVNPMPYFNAVSERFVRDWRQAKIVFVIKDERDREHDQILGVVSLRLRDVLKDRTQFTRWYPLVGGLGWGKLRISLLFKPLDMRLPRGLSTYEACTFDLVSLSTVDLEQLLSVKNAGLIIETEHDRVALRPPYDERPSQDSHRSHPSGEDGEEHDPERPPGSHLALSHLHTLNTGHQALDWDLPGPIRLAVKYRHSCCVLFSVAARRVLKKSKVHALAVLRLDDVPDGEDTFRTIPVFSTSSAKDAMKASFGFAAHQADPGSPPPVMPDGVSLLGFIRLNFVLHQGVSRAHAKLCKRDFKFRCVYEAWEATRLTDHPNAANEPEPKVENDAYDLDSESSSDDEQATAAAAAMHDDDTKAMIGESGAHAKALHKKNRGIFQLKLARTGKYVKDKIEQKALAATQGTKLEHRPHGADMEVEHEGQSRL